MTDAPDALPAPRPDAVPATPDLDAVEAAVRRAIDERRPDLLDIVGNGELTIALKWEDPAGPCVVKRVPPFPGRAAAEQYAELVRGHVARLEAAGVRCVTTRLDLLDRADGATVVYHCQPLLAPATLADRVLAAAEPSADHPIPAAIVDAVVAAIGSGEPIDGQTANWCWYDGAVWQLDLSTPFLLDHRGRIRFDATGFLREYPMFARRLVYRELMKIAPHYSERVWVIEDVMTQLHRQGLEAWCPVYVEAARARHGLEVSPALARERFDADASFYPMLLRVKRFQRGWIQRTGRRYDGLLPLTTSFGR